jgi:ABC-type transport system involved in cytochrome bd biosynthesis fused ATPase/permease subunit
VLSDIFCQVKPGDKIALMGKENSGKTAFILALLGEITNRRPHRLKLNGITNFMSLDWEVYVKGTLRQNIVLSKQFYPTLYWGILDRIDINVKKFQGEDHIQVEEDGNNFSTTDKRKLMVARMLYQGGDIFLFDRFFDDVDQLNRKDLFEKVLKELKNKTVLFVTGD